MNSTEQLKSRLHLSTASFLIAAMGAFGSAGAIAQDSDTAAEEGDIEEVVITGSRIKRTGFDTVAPATVVDSEFMDLRGFDNVATALNELPAFGIPGSSNFGGQGSQNVGQNFVNAFGLGSQRTLTLINGRRSVGQNTPTTVGNGAASGLQVDLNIIPTALIERVETVFTGGAPIYGSDAIAGTVNIILKDDFEGLEVDGQYGFSDNGDTENYRFRSTMGGNFADGRGNVVVSLEYSKQNGLDGRDRPELRDDYSYCTNPENGNSSDGIPDTILCNDASTVWQVPTTGYILLSDSFARTNGANVLQDANGNPTILGLNGELLDFASNIGNPRSIFFTEGANPNFVDNPLLLSLGETNTLVSPLERYTFNALSHYDITENVRFFTEALYSRSESIDTQNQPAWATTFFGPGAQGNLRINATDNPYVSDEILTALESPTGGIGFDPTLNDGDPLTDDDAQYFYVTRANIDITGGSPNRRDQDVFRFVGGLEGDFELADREFNWEFAYTFGQTNATSSQSNLNGERLAYAIDAVDDGSGNIVCRAQLEANEHRGGGVADPAANNDVDNCIPINILGFNQFGDDARDYLIQQVYQATQIQQTVIEATLAGSLMDLPAGELGFAAGVTNRRERGRFDVDQASQIGIDPSAPLENVAGAFDTKEAYAEFLIPLIADNEGIPGMGSFVKNWEIETAVRYVDNNVAGGGTTWTVGSRLNLDLPVLGDSLTLRGNFTKAIRAPSIPELFLPTSQTFNFASDPCDPRFIQGGPVPSTRAANCASEFAAAASGLDTVAFNVASGSTDADGNAIPNTTPVALANYTAIIANASQAGTTGGNVNLQNEESDAWSIGFVFQPDFVPGLTVSADWTDIALTNAIVNVSATQIANACYDSANFPNEPSCGQFSRAADTFQFQNPATGFVNAANRDLAAMIVDVNYSFDLADISESLPGSMNLAGNFFYLDKHEQRVGSGDIDNFQAEQFNERYRWQVNATYTLDRFSGLLQWRHISSGVGSNENSEERRDSNTFESYDTFNLSLQYQLTDNLRIRGVVNNLFQEVDGPRRQAGQGNGNNFLDSIGRRFILGVSASF